jgi:hypothetical protein
MYGRPRALNGQIIGNTGRFATDARYAANRIGMQWQAGAIYVADLVNGARSDAYAEGSDRSSSWPQHHKDLPIPRFDVSLPVLADDPKQRRANIPLAKSAMEGPRDPVGWD